MQCKSYSHFFSKNIRILYIESAKTVNEMTLNELVKLTTLWTTGPWIGSTCIIQSEIYPKSMDIFVILEIYDVGTLHLSGALGPVVQNFTKLLANIQIFISKYGKYSDIFYWKNVNTCKSYSHFCSKNINVFENILATTVNEFVVNKLLS